LFRNSQVIILLFLIAKKGVSAIDDVFAAPPTSTRQTLNPEEYLNGTVGTTIDYTKLLQKLEPELPIKEMRSQKIDIGSMVLHALIVSQGISEKEAVALSDNCLDGIVFSAAKQALKPSSVSIIIVNFKNRETAIAFDEMGKKVFQSETAQFKARLNTTFKILKEENLKLNGFDFIRFRHSERKVDEEITPDITAVGIHENVYVEMSFKNLPDLTGNDVLKFMGLINNELVKD
jgi:hypothetical protein